MKKMLLSLTFMLGTALAALPTPLPAQTAGNSVTTTKTVHGETTVFTHLVSVSSGTSAVFIPRMGEDSLPVIVGGDFGDYEVQDDIEGFFILRVKTAPSIQPGAFICARVNAPKVMHEVCTVAAPTPQPRQVVLSF